MSNKKDDLTRIEDLGEFIHELSEEEDLPPTPDFSADVPDLPEADSSSDFGTDFSGDFSSDNEAADLSTGEDLDFTSNLSFSDSNELTDTESESFSSEFSGDFSTDTNQFDSSSFDSTDNFESVESTDSMDEETSQMDSSDFLSTSDDTSWTESSISESLPDLDPSPIADEPSPSSSIPAYTPSKEFKTPENFADLKKFSENSSFAAVAHEGNPSFSVLIRNVRFIEDVNDIVLLLKELNLLSDSEEQIKGRLMRGTLLVSRISEYAAIFLAHKLRRFDIDIQLGLSDEIHPPKHQETPEIGIVSKLNLYQNQSHHFHFDDPKIQLSDIIIAATPSIEGYQVIRYLGVASEHKMLDSRIVEDESSDEIPTHYQELAQKLKAHALKAHSNAVVGLNYQLTPIPTEYGVSGHKYRLTCTGNLVWINKL